MAALLTVGALVTALTTMGPASAFDGPNGHHQFVQVISKYNGGWTLDMALHDKDGRTVYTWHKDHIQNYKETLWYTIGAGYIDGTIVADNGDQPIARPFHYTAKDADGHCWVVDRRDVWLTGDTNGNCTPD
ncbi:MAG TPA: hypothetical protein VI248_24445 [Kineosporiaceae bacterium]